MHPKSGSSVRKIIVSSHFPKFLKKIAERGIQTADLRTRRIKDKNKPANLSQNGFEMITGYGTITCSKLAAALLGK